MTQEQATERASELWDGVYLVRPWIGHDWEVILHSSTGPRHFLHDRGEPENSVPCCRCCWHEVTP